MTHAHRSPSEFAIPFLSPLYFIPKRVMGYGNKEGKEGRGPHSEKKAYYRANDPLSPDLLFAPCFTSYGY